MNIIRGLEILVHNNFFKRFITSIIILLLLFLCLILNSTFINIVFLLIFLVYFYEIIIQLIRNQKSRTIFYYLFCFSYTFLFLHSFFIVYINDKWKWILLLNFIIVFLSDTFGYIFGKMFRGKPLNTLRNISPNKTIEGYLGSIIISFSVASIFLINFYEEYFQIFSLPKLFAIVFMILLTSLLGDLLVSKIKRIIDIKDFSNLLYGHGGFLDRLDSLIPSFATSFWIFFLL
ncbi:MAG: phosphatidate cytidylyltransferase [Chloroflexota bacterium]|nr:phosphatidate cytidylyltransferase [Chloroflexota bacterium]